MTKRLSILVLCTFTFFFMCGCQLFNPISLSDLWASIQREAPTTPAAEIEPTTTPADLVASMSMIEIYRSEESEEFAYSISMAHPQLENAGISGETFNQVVTDKLLISVEEFRNSAQESYETRHDLGGSSFYDLNYSVYRFDQQFISVLFNIETYFIGAAHPGMTHFVMNYDLLTEQEITLGDLFLPNSQILNVLQYYSAQELENRFPEGYFENGLETIANNYRNWNLTQEGFLLTFETYQVQSGAAGPQTVLIPYFLLEDYIDPDGPLGYIVEQQNQENTF